MCKILAVIGCTEPNELLDFMIEAEKPMSLYNDDGIGYTAIKKDGSIFMEKWVDNDNLFFPPTQHNLEEELDGLVDVKSVSNTEVYASLNAEQTPLWHNTAFNDVCSMFLHTRKATCAKNISNTHPFLSVDKQTALIHNGVISNSDSFTKPTSTCDSEAILVSYLEHEINKNPEDIQNVFDDLNGSFAAVITSVDASGKRILDVFRNDTSPLYITKSENLGGLVICTSPITMKEIFDACGFVNMNPVYKMSDNIFARFDIETGKVLNRVECKYEYRWGKHGQTYPNTYGGYYSGNAGSHGERESDNNVTKTPLAIVDKTSTRFPNTTIFTEEDRDTETLFEELVADNIKKLRSEGKHLLHDVGTTDDLKYLDSFSDQLNGLERQTVGRIVTKWGALGRYSYLSMKAFNTGLCE